VMSMMNRKTCLTGLCQGENMVSIGPFEQHSQEEMNWPSTVWVVVDNLLLQGFVLEKCIREEWKQIQFSQNNHPFAEVNQRQEE